MKDDRNIEYLVGKKAKLDVFLEPFSFKIVSFLDDLSKALDNNSNNKKTYISHKNTYMSHKTHIFRIKNTYI